MIGFHVDPAFIRKNSLNWNEKQQTLKKPFTIVLNEAKIWNSYKD